MIMYKLVTQEWTSHKNMSWSIGKVNKAKGKGKQLCSPDLLHCYKSPAQAVLFNSIHAKIENPILLEVECSEILADDGLKFGCKEQTPVRVIPLPEITLEQKTAFAINCALEAYSEKSFVLWADKWLSGEDRSIDAASIASRATEAAVAATRVAEAAIVAARVVSRAEEVAGGRVAGIAAQTAVIATNKKIDFDTIITKVWIE